MKLSPMINLIQHEVLSKLSRSSAITDSLSKDSCDAVACTHGELELVINNMIWFQPCYLKVQGLGIKSHEGTEKTKYISRHIFSNVLVLICSWNLFHHNIICRVS